MRRARNIQTNQLTINNISFNHRNSTDLRFSRQDKNFDISHSFWGLMEAEKIHLLVTVGSVIFRLAKILLGGMELPQEKVIHAVLRGRCMNNNGSGNGRDNN